MPSVASLIVKLTARCDIDCSYCYMFRSEDQTFKHVPKMMSLCTAKKTVRRAIEHASSRSLERFAITLHGGEPTLWPRARWEALLDYVDVESSRANVELEVSVQTNLYTPRWDTLALLHERGIRIGVSLDGPAEYNDRYRRNHRGEGTYGKVIANAEKLAEEVGPGFLAGFLCVANPSIPPERFIDWVDLLPTKTVSLLWPMEFNHENPPWTHFGEAQENYRQNPKLGVWFASVFNVWLDRNQPDIKIRYFDSLIRQALGSRQHEDSVGAEALELAVVNTDGGFERHDYFRWLGDGRTRTQFNVHNHKISDLEQDPLVRWGLEMPNQVPASCARCAFQKTCGGGFLPGRISRRSSSLRRSVHCFDQFELFRQLRARLFRLPPLKDSCRPPPFAGMARGLTVVQDLEPRV